METIFSGPLGALLLAVLMGTAAVFYFLHKNAPRQEAPAAAPARFDGIPPEHVAAIAAAIAALPGRRRIVHIEAQRGTRSWSGQARLDHHSHSIDKYRRGASW